MAKICLDYGHGGKDPGTVYKGRKESNDNLSLGRAVAAELSGHGVEVIETRATDKVKLCVDNPDRHLLHHLEP
jgi:N-acetylmuramoyl-L-alanine amidase